MRYLILISCLLVSSCQQPTPLSKLEQIKASGELVVLTRYSPTTYYEGVEDLSGIEFDLIQLFSQRIGVKPNFILPDNFNQILSLISEGEADIAAAGLTVTEERKYWMRFAPSYQTITEQLLYKSGTPRPRKIQDLSKGILEVLHGSSHVETLSKLRQNHFGLHWLTTETLSSDDLIELVDLQLIDYTVADSNQVDLYRQLFPKLHVAFDISEPRKLAWALPKSKDDSLFNEVTKFFEEIKKDGTLEQLIEKNFGHAKNFNYVGNCTFRSHIKTRLPAFRKQFEDAAEKNDLDWRLLAAIGYQESHWNPRAVSPTGVRGIMMLTQATARQLKVKNRMDPIESIFGGARYFSLSHNRIPDRITEPDRTWMALAAYNVGFGHLEDSRVLTAKLGKNPDKWIDVKKHLPLLSKKKWYSQTRHGYARGREPVKYVENIRKYFELLSWITRENDDSHPVEEELSPLDFEIPAL